MSIAQKMLCGAVLVASAVAAAPASANPADSRAYTQWLSAVSQSANENTRGAAEDATSTDNITCDPTPVVDGRMVNPRAGAVVGEVYAQAEMHAHLKCVSLDTGARYSLYGTVTDMYFSGGAYVAGQSSGASMAAVAGATTVNPVGVMSYPGGHRGINTWHYAYFRGTTSTGRVITGVSPLFYVAGV